jgi:hypothetical protein
MRLNKEGDSMLTMFKESSGLVSMRRILSFLFAAAGVSGGILALIMQSDWKIVASAFGVPGVLSLGFLILTTVSDVKEIVSAVKELK